MREARGKLCPSYRPEAPAARAFAVVVGTPRQPELAFLARAQAVSEKLLALAGDLDPTEVFRFAGPCAGPACLHLETSSGDCQLVRRTVQKLAPEVDRLAPCTIRQACKWWNQERRAACERCAGIVSSHSLPSEAFRQAARPPVPGAPVNPYFKAKRDS